MDKIDGEDRQFEFICSKCRKHFWEDCPDGEYYEYSFDYRRYIIRKADGEFRRMVVCPKCAKYTVVVRPRLIPRANRHTPRRFDNLKG